MTQLPNNLEAIMSTRPCRKFLQMTSNILRLIWAINHTESRKNGNLKGTSGSYEGKQTYDSDNIKL